MSSNIRDMAKKAMSAKLHRLGAQGNLKSADKAECAPRKYATGGSVMEDMGDVEGDEPEPSFAKSPRKGKDKDGKGKKGTNVNVIIMQAPAGGDKAPAMPPPGAMAGPPPMPPGPPMGPPPGGPPMRARGGRVMDAGAGSGVGRLEKIGKK